MGRGFAPALSGGFGPLFHWEGDMLKPRFLLIVFVSGLITAFSANAVLPFVIGGFVRQAILLTAEEATVGVIARGLQANSPFVRTTATLSRTRLAANIAANLRGSRWSGFLALMAAFAGLGWDYDDTIGLYTIQKQPIEGGYCPMAGIITSQSGCLSAAYPGKLPEGGGWTTQPVTIACSNWPDNSVCASGNVLKQIKYCLLGVVGPKNCYNNQAIPFNYYRDAENLKVPVPAAEINSKGLPAIASSPNTLGDMFAGANSDMLNKLLDGSTIPYNPTTPSPEMAQLKSDYRNGLLQSLDPNAPHYVTPELMKQIQDLVAAEDALNTDEGLVDSLNSQMKQPLTQAQYEESNLKTETAQAGSLEASLGAAFEPIAQLKQDNDFILDKMASPPEPPSGVGFFKWTLPTGSCSGFSVDMSVGNGKLHTSKMVNEFCPFYESVAHPLLFWFLNIATFLYLFWLWDRSVSDMAR